MTVRKSVPGVKLGVINCQSISGKLDFVFDEYQGISIGHCGVDRNVVV